MQHDRRRFLAQLAGLGATAALIGCRSRVSVQPEPGAGDLPDLAADPFAELAGTCDGIPAITKPELEARIAQASARMHELGIDALIVEAGHDMRWLGGPRWGRSERPLLLVLPRAGEPTLLGPSFEAGTLRSQQTELELALATWDEHEDPYRIARALVGDTGAKQIALGEDTRLFIVEGLRAADPATALRSATPVLAPLRRRKSPAELALLRRANEATKLAIAKAAPLLREGMAEHEFGDLITAAQRSAGLGECWALVLFGPNAAFPHGTPEGRTLHADDLVLVDTGGFLHGYASDITRTWAFGDPKRIDARRRAAWGTVRAAQQAAIERIRPGVRCAEVDAAARAVIAAAGFDPDYGHFTHRLGHGIGMQVHEPPYLVRDGEHVLEPGNTMSDEPGVYSVGEFGIRLEDIVAVTADGCEVFGPLATSLDVPFG